MNWNTFKMIPVTLAALLGLKGIVKMWFPPDTVCTAWFKIGTCWVSVYRDGTITRIPVRSKGDFIHHSEVIKHYRKHLQAKDLTR